MTISEVNSKLKTVTDTYNTQKELCASSHQDSYFYANDVKGQEGYYKDINRYLNTLKGDIAKIKSFINTDSKTSFHNTHGSLSSLENQIPESITKTLEENVLLASQTAFSELLNQFNSNNSKIDEYITLIERAKKSYYAYDEKISSKERAIDRARRNGQSTASLESEKSKLKKQRDAELILCDGWLKSIDALNKKNLELLEKGLKKS